MAQIVTLAPQSIWPFELSCSTKAPKLDPTSLLGSVGKVPSLLIYDRTSDKAVSCRHWPEKPQISLRPFLWLIETLPARTQADADA